MNRVGWLLVSVVLVISGCATPYQKRTARFGYDDFRIAEDLFEVSFSGNVKTPISDVSKYVFRRASEVTLTNGFTHFIPIGEADQSLQGSVNTASGQSTRRFWGQSASSH